MFKKVGDHAVQFGKHSASIIIFLLLWELLVTFRVLDYRFFPAPSAVIVTIYHLFASGELFYHIASSLQRVFLGFLVGASLGLVIGLIMGWSKIAEQVVDPLISVFYPIPKTALLPLLLILFGIGEASKVAIVAIAVFFTVAINTAAGVRTIDPVLIDAARNFGAKGARMFTKVVIPASLPSIFTGVRLGLGIALVVIIAAEMVAANSGLGYLIWMSWSTLSTKKMYAGIVIIGLIGFITNDLLKWTAKRVMPWAVVEQERVVVRKELYAEKGVNFINRIKAIPNYLVSYTLWYCYALSKETTLPKPSSSLDDLKFVWIDHTNVEAILPWKGRGTVRNFKRKLNQGMIGIYAFYDKQVIGFVWGGVKTASYANCCGHIPINIGDGYTQTAEVNQEYRRLGVGSSLRYYLIYGIRSLSTSLGVKRISGMALKNNIPLLKIVRRQGSVRTQEINLLKITPWIYIHQIWDLDDQQKRINSSGRWIMNIKIPDFLYDPVFQKVVGGSMGVVKRNWQPKGEVS